MVIFVRRAGTAQRETLQNATDRDAATRPASTMLRLVSTSGGQEPRAGASEPAAQNTAYSQTVSQPVMQTIPLKQEGVYWVVRRPKEYSGFTETRGMIKPDCDYTLTEAAVLSGLPRTAWRLLVSPRTNDSVVQVPSIVRDNLTRIMGNEVLGVVAKMDDFPENVASVKDLAKLIGRSYFPFRNSIISHAGERFIPYKRTADAKTILVPVYTKPCDRSPYVDARDFDYIKNDFALRNRLMTWEEAQKYLEERGIDLCAAQLKRILHQLIEKDGKKLFIRYVSPDGAETIIPVLRLTRGGLPGICHKLRESDIERIYLAAKKDQEEFVRYSRVQATLGLKRKSECLSFEPRTFRLDGQAHSIRLYEKGHKAYMKRADAEIFREWTAFERKRSNEFIEIKQHVCHSFDGDGCEETFGRFEKALIKDGAGFLVSLSDYHGLRLRIREFEGRYYVRNDGHMEALRLFLNITHQSSRVRSIALGRLEPEIAALSDLAKANISLMMKLWTARALYVQTWHLYEPATAMGALERFYDFLGSKSVVRLFGMFPLESLPEFAAKSGSDFRFDK